jgi:hypothetical protein
MEVGGEGGRPGCIFFLVGLLACVCVCVCVSMCIKCPLLLSFVPVLIPIVK